MSEIRKFNPCKGIKERAYNIPRVDSDRERSVSTDVIDKPVLYDMVTNGDRDASRLEKLEEVQNEVSKYRTREDARLTGQSPWIPMMVMMN
jgi:hypothetical protein